MRSQFWKQITPVKHHAIPDCAEYFDGDSWYTETRGTFHPADLACKWRVPVEACPMSIAVDALASSADFNHDKQQYEVWIVDGYTSGCTEQGLKEAITSRLRELSEKEFPE